MAELIKYAIGIDISKDKFDASFCEMDADQNIIFKSSRCFPCNHKSFKEFERWSGKLKKQDLPLVMLMEATGVYYEKLAHYLFQRGYSVSVVLPLKSKKYFQALGLKSKTDKIDAKGLAQMAAEQKLPLWKPLGDFFYNLRQLTRHHVHLQKLKTTCNNQLHALKHCVYNVKEVVIHTKRLVAVIDKQIEENRNAIRDYINQNKEVKRKVENICKIKGLGLLSVASVIAETNGFLLFENIRQLTSFSGYDVVENRSGKYTGKTKISKKGNHFIRRSMHMPSLIVVRYKQKPFMDLYHRVYERTKVKMKGYVAVQKKLLIYIYTLWKSDQSFEVKEKSSSGNNEPKTLFLLGSNGTIRKVEVQEKEIVPIKTGTTQDELPCNKSPEALFLRL